MRIPIFFIGLLYADNEDMLIPLCKKWNIVFLFLSAFFFLLLLADCNKWIEIPILHQPLLYIIVSLPLICIVSYFFQQKIKIFNLIILFCGKYSLQLYLIHVMYFNIIIHHVYFFSQYNLTYMFILAILLSFPSAFLLSKMEGRIIKYL